MNAITVRLRECGGDACACEYNPSAEYMDMLGGADGFQRDREGGVYA